VLQRETTSLPPPGARRSLTLEGAFHRGPPCSRTIALGLFAAGLASLLIGAGLPYLKHLAVGLISVLA
jgi:hypothetical protein